jgi:hypothetical protein
MRFERAGRLLFIAAALAAGSPLPANASGRIIWLELCDALHPGRKIPLPLDPDDRPFGQACHAACALISHRRSCGRGAP